MRLRKILIAGSAVAVAAAFALVPAAQASTPGGNVGSIRVGVNTTGDHPFTGSLKSGVSITIQVYGEPMKVTCSSGNIAGTVHGGTINPVLNFTSLPLVCDSFFEGQTLTFNVPSGGCANWTWSSSALVHDGLTDYGPKGAKFQEVLGSFNLPTGCYVTVVAGPCTFTIGGSTTSNFYEAKSSTVATQGLNLKGSGLTVKSAGFLCLGSVGVGDPVTFNSFDINIASAYGAIDFRDN